MLILQPSPPYSMFYAIAGKTFQVVTIPIYFKNTNSVEEWLQGRTGAFGAKVVVVFNQEPLSTILQFTHRFRGPMLLKTVYTFA